eukprot:TRINITY_DN4520_c0_g2_i7.p1 TRINITY_DN4520_c0_g2~~TRINITY_DN4520_c0_g2_i7.p1  ORF type:complete len:197 (-),score=47.24 TRINITY_DN4520_c0_g2_i7:57-647(-)
MLNYLLQLPGVDITANDNFAIRFSSHLHIIDRLLQLPGVDATALDNYAIQWAAKKRRVAVVTRLLQLPGVDPSVADNVVLQEAIKHGFVDLVELLLRDVRVVVGLGLAPELVSKVAQEDEIRCVMAVAKCAEVEVFRGKLVRAFRVAYECVRVGLYPGLAEQIGQHVWPVILVRRAVAVQRNLALALQRLRQVRAL